MSIPHMIDGRIVYRLKDASEPCALCGEKGADIPYRLELKGKWGSHIICDSCYVLERRQSRLKL